MAKKSANSNPKDTNRYRNFATVVYPESAPENWRELLLDLKIPCFISPLHDKDINPNGEPKKAHYHVEFAFEGKKSREQVAEMVASFGGVGCEVVNSLRGYARYLCHLDNPEKAQYNPDDVQAYCMDYTESIGLPTDNIKAIRDMITFCQRNHVLAYSDLLEYCSECKYDWFRVLCQSASFVMKEYIKSVAWKNEKNIPDFKIVDENGEVFEWRGGNDD